MLQDQLIFVQVNVWNELISPHLLAKAKESGQFLPLTTRISKGKKKDQMIFGNFPAFL